MPSTLAPRLPSWRGNDRFPADLGRERREQAMHNGERRVDKLLGYLGLLLIGALGWAADHVRLGLTAPERTAHPHTAHATGRARA
jgi:hypothetical protein